MAIACKGLAALETLMHSFVTWPLHDIAITNIVWCMAQKGGVGGGRILRNGRAIVLQ